MLKLTMEMEDSVCSSTLHSGGAVAINYNKNFNIASYVCTSDTLSNFHESSILSNSHTCKMNMALLLN